MAVTVFSTIDAPDLWANYGQPLAWIAPILFVIALGLTGRALWGSSERGPILGSSLSIAALIAIVGQALYPALVPDRIAGADLTVSNASSSDLSLSVMLIVALIGVPIVLAYTAFVYRRFVGKVAAPDTYA